MPVYRLPEELGQSVIQYLASRPYAEVYKLIAQLQALEEIEPIPEKED